MRNVKVYKAVPGDRTPKTPSLIHRFQQMRRSVLTDLAANRGSYLRAVAKVHPAPHTRVAFLGMNLLDARVVARIHASEALEV